VSGYRPDKGFVYCVAIDAKWGDGPAKFLYNLSRPTHTEGTAELEQLWSAARIGPRAYDQLYFILRPSHHP
jgi:hypothetical protein